LGSTPLFDFYLIFPEFIFRLGFYTQQMKTAGHKIFTILDNTLGETANTFGRQTIGSVTLGSSGWIAQRCCL
jgi:hypothetical protein